MRAATLFGSWAAGLAATVQAGDDKDRHFQVATGFGGQHFYGVLHGI